MVLSHSLCVKATKHRNAHRLEKRELTSFRVNVSCMRYIFSPWPPKVRSPPAAPFSAPRNIRQFGDVRKNLPARFNTASRLLYDAPKFSVEKNHVLLN